MTILEFKDIDREEWSRLVLESRTDTWFQMPEAYCLYESLPELFKPFVVAVERVRELENERVSELKGVCMGFVTVEKSAAKQFFTRRAIIMGGPALADDCTEEEVTALMNSVRQRLQSQAIYVETRNFNDYSRWKDAFAAAGFEYRPHLNFHVDCADKEKMWERLSETRCKQIRRAQRNGAVIAEAQSVQEIHDGYAILQKMYRKKVKTPLWPLEFFIEAYKQGIGKYLMVKYNEMVIGGLLMVEDAKCVYEWFECGMNAEYKEQYPSVMATYAGMQFANEHNIPRCDLMGAGEPDVPYGVRDFKEKFGGEMVEHGRFLCITKPMLFKIGTIGVKILKRLS